MKTFIVSHISKAAIIFSLLIFLSPGYSAESEDEFLNLDLEDLLSIEVTSVSKKKQKLSEVASAVFVISQEDIRRSGVTSIPEALRMAPGVNVARFDANKWAITTRGFNGQNANKLLVLIDGRTVYTPSYSGVYWDVQDTLLEDIDRIEVIRGPGATIWGANAVNGVINIITKFANISQGGVVSIGGGDKEKNFASFRYGAELGKFTQGRFYLKSFKRDSFVFAENQNDANDNWTSLRAGFRFDSNPAENDKWTIQGDFYQTESNQTIAFTFFDPVLFDVNSLDPATPPATVIPAIAPGYITTIENKGWNLLGRWSHTFNEQSAASLQVYYDKTERGEFFLRQKHDTFDIELQHQFSIATTHEVVWGFGYRNIKDDFDNTFLVKILPSTGAFELYNIFIQDQVELIEDNIYLTFGTKLEHNDAIGFEIQPSIKTLWKIDDKSSLWASISKASRTPSRVEKDSLITTFTGVVTTGNPIFPVAPISTSIIGNDGMQTEELIAYEFGYRVQPLEILSLDLSIFYNDYDRLQTFERINNITVMFDNKMAGHASGLEAAIDWRILPWWKIQSNFSSLKVSLKLDEDSQDIGVTLPVGEGSSPENQFSLRTSVDFDRNWEMDLWIYYVDKLDAAGPFAWIGGTIIEDYTSLNFRLSWQPREDLQFSIVGQNLQNGSHSETIGEELFGLTETAIERSVYAKMKWNF